MSVPPETIASPACAKVVGEGPGVFDDGGGIAGKGRLQRLAERHRLGGDHMHQRAALQAGEDGGVDPPADLLVLGEDHARRAARAGSCASSS